MGDMNPYTLEEKHLIEKLLKENTSYSKICVALGRTDKSVISHIRNNGGKNNYKISFFHNSANRFSQDEKNKAFAMKNSGATLLEISIALNRSYSGLLRFFGDRNKKRAADRALLLKKKTNSERLETIEQQLEIIIDVLTKKGII